MTLCAMTALFFLAAITRAQGLQGDAGTCDAGDSACEVANAKEEAFFNTYSSPEAQANMVLDRPRTLAYKDAMMHTLNKKLFKGKVVLDVGCGTGILSLFAAKAGAKAVYCVELTQISRLARQIAEKNGLSHIITVIQGKIEEVTLPTQEVDIIISEWMGYFCLFEGMFRSVIWARDRYLRAGGHMLPDKLDMYIGAATQQAVDVTEKKIAKWAKPMYGLDLTTIGEVLIDWANYETTSLTQQWRTGTYPEIAQIKPEQMLTKGEKVASIDMQTVRADELDKLKATVELEVVRGGEFDRIVGWFDSYFTRGGKTVELPTGPHAKSTHWHQMVFHLNEGFQVKEGAKTVGVHMTLTTAGAFQREMRVKFDTRIPAVSKGEKPTLNSKGFTVVILPDTSQWSGVGH